MDIPKPQLKDWLARPAEQNMPMQLFKERVLTFNSHMRILRNLLMVTMSTDPNFSEPAMKKMLA